MTKFREICCAGMVKSVFDTVTSNPCIADCLIEVFEGLNVSRHCAMTWSLQRKSLCRSCQVRTMAVSCSRVCNLAMMDGACGISWVELKARTYHLPSSNVILILFKPRYAFVYYQVRISTIIWLGRN